MYTPSPLSFAWNAGSPAPMEGSVYDPNRLSTIATHILFKISKKLNFKFNASVLNDRLHYGQIGQNRIFLSKDTSLLFEESQFLTDKPTNTSAKLKMLYLPNAKTEIRLEHKTNGQIQDLSSRSSFNGEDGSWQATQNYLSTQTQFSCIYAPNYGGRWEISGLQYHHNNYQNQRFNYLSAAQQNRVNQDFGQINMILPAKESFYFGNRDKIEQPERKHVYKYPGSEPTPRAGKQFRCYAGRQPPAGSFKIEI